MKNRPSIQHLTTQMFGEVAKSESRKVKICHPNANSDVPNLGVLLTIKRLSPIRARIIETKQMHVYHHRRFSQRNLREDFALLEKGKDGISIQFSVSLEASHACIKLFNMSNVCDLDK